MPAVEVIESSGRNAYASGFHPQNSAIGASRGLLDNLNNAELEAVLAHEVAHIEGRDNRLMTIANLVYGRRFQCRSKFPAVGNRKPHRQYIYGLLFCFFSPHNKNRSVRRPRVWFLVHS